MTGPDPTSWRERALAALETHEHEVAVYAAKQQADEAAALAKALTILFGQHVYATRTPIDLDGLRFVPGYDPGEFGRITPRLLGTCPDCGKEAASKLIFGLHQLGALLREFVPYGHLCAAGNWRPDPAPSIEDRLAAVMRDLVDERVDYILSTRSGDE